MSVAREVERVSVQAAQRTIRCVQFRLAYRTTKLLENLTCNASSITAERRCATGRHASETKPLEKQQEKKEQ